MPTPDPLLPAPRPPAPPAPALPSTPPPLTPWAWAAAVVLGQPTAHRVVHAFFFGLIGLVTVLAGVVRGCR